MPKMNPAALDFLLTRHSYPAKLMRGAVPSRDEVTQILTAAARCPDHGKLEPWRFIVLEKAAMARLASLAEARAVALGGDSEKIAKGRGQFDNGALAVVVIASPKAAAKVPQIEQTLSAGAACLGVVNAAQAAGWAACWLSGWVAHDKGFVEQGFGLAPQEFVAGIIHLGSETSASVDRPRPDIATLTTWVEA